MSDFKDVPTEQLLSFQEFTPVHQASFSSAELNVDMTKQNQKGFDEFTEGTNIDNIKPLDDINETNDSVKSFWSIEFYQSLFDVDTNDVIERIFASFIPKRDSTFKSKIKSRPDLYGPIWISITLIFAIAIGGNNFNYLVSQDPKHPWKYNFNLVSYAATAIYIYIGIIPVALWALLKWSTTYSEADEMEIQDNPPNLLELICVYGYSIFIYVPTAILCSIKVRWVQWAMIIIAAILSGSVLLYTLMPALRKSKYKIILIISILVFHFLFAAGSLLFFFS